MPERIIWTPGQRFMEHYVFPDDSWSPEVTDRVAPVEHLECRRCVTRLTLSPQPEVLCPCGVVLWDLSLVRSERPRSSGALPIPIDSERSSLAEWIQGVDALVREVHDG